MNNLLNFNFEDNDVEVIVYNNEPLFNARNVGFCLDMSESVIRDHTSKMNDKQVIKLTNAIISSSVGLIDTRKLNNFGENFLTESGVYKLILKSRKPEAEKFQD